MSDKELLTVYCDGVQDDTDALQGYLDGEAELVHEDGSPFDGLRNYINGSFGAKGQKYKTTKVSHIGRKI